MNIHSQFKAMLAKIEDDTLKGELTEAFDKVEGVFTDAVSTRDKVKDTNKSLSTLKQEIAEMMGFDDDFSTEDIKKILDSKNSNKDLEKLKADLTTKYETDMETLRGELSQKDNSFNELQSKYNDTLFNSAITNSGLLDAFVDEPMARQNIISKIKDSLIYEDGNVYVKDNTTGEKAKDIKTNEFLKPESVVKSISETINPMYLKSDVQGQGGGTPPNQNPQRSNTQNRSKMSASEKGAYIKENGNDAYLNLPN